MSKPTVSDLRADILKIEQDLDAKSYEPGPWAAFLRQARKLSVDERRELSEDVSRVSNKLHLNNHPGPTMAAKKAIIIETVVMLGGIVDIFFGVHLENPWIVGISAFVVCATSEPLFKILVGHLLGVRYSHFWIWNYIEPRAKMFYGTYLVLTSRQRVILHAAGMVGSAASFLIVGFALLDIMPGAAEFCLALGGFFVALNTVLVVLGFLGVKAIQRTFSGGVMAHEVMANRRARNAS